MKRLLIGSLCVGTIFLIGGCGAVEKTPEDKNKKAIEEISDAINGRWDSQEAGAKVNYKNVDLVEILEKENAEIVEAKANITDKEILEDVDNYIEGSNFQIKGSKTEDSELAYDYIEDSEELRKPALIALVDEHGMVIDEQNKQIYEDFKAKATIINKEKGAEDFAKKLATEIKLEKTKEYSWHDYSSVVENTSDIGFSSISYNISFLAFA